MARNSTGRDTLKQARHDLTTASTTKQLRVAQAVVFPLDLGISLARTAELIGMTSGWVARSRIRYITLQRKGKTPDSRGGRRNSLLTPDEEKEFVRLGLLGIRNTWDTLVISLKKSLEQKVRRPVALSTVYNILNRVKKADPEQYRNWHSYEYYLAHRIRIPA